MRGKALAAFRQSAFDGLAISLEAPRRQPRTANDTDAPLSIRFAVFTGQQVIGQFIGIGHRNREDSLFGRYDDLDAPLTTIGSVLLTSVCPCARPMPACRLSPLTA